MSLDAGDSQGRTTNSDLVGATTEKRTPWFVDLEEVSFSQTSVGRGLSPFYSSHQPPRPSIRPLPDDVPSALQILYVDFARSPLIDPAELLVREPFSLPLGPALPDTVHGKRRKRGFREIDISSIGPVNSALWDWVMLVQLKEGIDRTRGVTMLGALAKRTMAKQGQRIQLPPRAKRQVDQGWTMIDANSFAVHILSKEAREKYFGKSDVW
ncbi:hypothetical protein K488DRAFT_50148 [Vararia minispora EC-137]|uniref:Uncharacterized protein n=1 Tax=Vararia minispora EC-137 TaxID=1314806 RepID=A0ACB8QKQ3_9AGAM|nr:hypothetical protein K488DRAFT_50148 [Vararia minispora EC-137]